MTTTAAVEGLVSPATQYFISDYNRKTVKVLLDILHFVENGCPLSHYFTLLSE